ncbi:MAG: DinB family protein [Bryobacteraceae bacterium]
MLDLLRPLFSHQEWADRELLKAAGACPAAVQDERLRTTLFHIVFVQRYFLSQFTGGEFDVQKEMKAPESWEGLADLFHSTHEAEQMFVSSVPAAELERILDLPRLKGVRPTVAQAMTQVVMHSQHHRGQCAMRLRDLGGVPPTLDYILWLREGPPPA